MTAGGDVIAKFEFCVMSEVAPCNSSVLFSWPHTVGVMFHTAHIVGPEYYMMLMTRQPHSFAIHVWENTFWSSWFECLRISTNLDGSQPRKDPVNFSCGSVQDLTIWDRVLTYLFISEGMIHYLDEKNQAYSGVWYLWESTKADCWEPQFPWIRSLEECKLEV